jgi:hypothetical protein
MKSDQYMQTQVNDLQVCLTVFGIHSSYINKFEIENFI